MKHKAWEQIKKILGTLAMSAGVLAIANMELIWQNYRASDRPESRINTQSKNPVAQKMNVALETRAQNFKPLQSELSRSLEQDELKDENPFAHLSNLEPLRLLMKKGVAKFHRDTYRSPDYQEESGYDLISYEIEHTDGGKSTILAYLEKPSASIWRNVGAPDQRVAYVVFLVAQGEKTFYSAFRAGDLIEQSELSIADAQNLVAKRLSESVPFLSVSR